MPEAREHSLLEEAPDQTAAVQGGESPVQATPAEYSESSDQGEEMVSASPGKTTVTVKPRMIPKAFSQLVEKKDKAQCLAYDVWGLIGVAVIVGIVIYLMAVLAIPVSIMIWTLIFIFCLRGIVNGLEARGLKRIWGTTISYVVMFAAIAVIAVLMFSPVFGLNTQFNNIAQSIPQYIDGIKQWFEGVYAQYNDYFDNETIKRLISDAQTSLSSWGSSIASGAAGAVVDIGTTIVNSVTAIGFALVIAFWILLDLPKLGAETRRIISPRFRNDASFLHLTFTRILGGYIKATLIQCVIIGVASGILYGILNIPNAAAMGVITGIMNIIPIIGPWIAGAIAAISAIFVSPLIALIAIIGVIVIQQFVYTFISPKIMQSSVDIHPVLTLFAMVVGSAIGGAMSGIMGSLVGMLFSIPACAVIKSCFIYYFEKHTGRQIVSAEGFFFKGDPSDDVNPLVDATGHARKERSHQMNHFIHDVEDKLHEIELDVHHKGEGAESEMHGETGEKSAEVPASPSPAEVHKAARRIDEVSLENISFT